MLSFGEMLDVLMKQHNFKNKDIYSKLGMSKSYFCRLKKGDIPPKNYELVRELVEVLELPNYEKQLLINAYKYTKLGDAFCNTEKSIEKLYSIKLPAFKKYADKISQNYKDDIVIKGMESIAEAVAGLINCSPHIDCLFIPENIAFCNMIKEISINKSNISWLVYLEDKEKTQSNISIFYETISLLFSHEIEVRYLYKSVDDYYQCTVFPYVFISDNEMILIDRKCETAFRFNDQLFINSYRDNLQAQFNVSNPFLMVLTGFEEYLENWEYIFGSADVPNSDDLLIVEKTPCIIHEAKHSEVSSHIADIENNDRLASIYFKFLKWSTQRLRKQEMMFTIDGIHKYFTADTFHEYSRHLTKSIPKPLRTQLFGRLIELSKKSNSLLPRIMSDFPFEESNLRVINIWKSGIVLIVFDFEEAFRVVVMQEKTISSTMWNYFQDLKACGIVLSEKESIQIMEKEYNNQIEMNKKNLEI